ncbi:hypothetical protein D3C86_1157440 [compost metagenome]
MAGGMPGHVDHAEGGGRMAQRHRVALAHRLGAVADTFAGRANHRHGGAVGPLGMGRQQVRHPALVIAMVMGDYNSAQCQPALGQKPRHGRGLAGVDDGGAMPVMDRPDIVVLECGD